ncbi:unnamed protein product [Camellia sinensis]
MEALLRLLRVALVFLVVAHFSLLAKSSSFSSQEFQIVNVESRELEIKPWYAFIWGPPHFTSAFGCPLVETVADELTMKVG